MPTQTDATVADVRAAAAQVDAPTEVVVEILRSRLNLGVVGITHALSIDAADYLRPGSRKVSAIVAAADQLWATVQAHPIEVVVPDMGIAWQSAAACRGKDPSLWFCDDPDNPDPASDDEIEAVNICATCPVIGQCALAALNEQQGMWAGMTTRNRQRLRRYLRRGVVAVTAEAVGPLAIDIGMSALQARIAVRPEPFTDDGRLFDIPESAEVTAYRRARRSPGARRSVVEPLFA